MQEQLEDQPEEMQVPSTLQRNDEKLCMERPPRGEALRDYEINIKFLHRGCVVGVGCKSIAFESVENAMKEINAYVTNPYDEREKWYKMLND